MKKIIFVGLLSLVSCTITYTDPAGGQLKFNFDDNPSPEKAAEAFGKLEEALKDNLIALRSAVDQVNPTIRDLATSNINRITKAKKDLEKYLPSEG